MIIGPMAELGDAPALEADSERSVGSSPTWPTIKIDITGMSLKKRIQIPPRAPKV